MALMGAGSTMAGVLYSQLDSPNGTNSVTSQNFEADFDAFDDELADDFVVPAGGGWEVDTVSVLGGYFNGSGPAPTVRVTFYHNSGTFPGSAIAACNYPAIVPGGAGANFTLSLAPACMLAPGTYWVAVVANMDFALGGQWGWTSRTVTSNHPAAWRNPGGGFGDGVCVSFGARAATCGLVPGAPDQLFSLSGTELCPCAGPRDTTQSWKNHGQYVSCVAEASQSFVRQGLITPAEKGAIVSAAGRSSCGK